MTPKQLLFFTPLIQDLQKKGHKVISTSRKYIELELLSLLRGSDLTLIGRHGGESLIEKLKASNERCLHLSEYIKKLGIDYAISFSSPECARVAFGMDIKHFCISDSPHAEKVCKLTIPLSDILLSPSIIPYSAWSEYGIYQNKIVTYDALDPVAWLKRISKESAKKEDYGLSTTKKTICVRLEESQASYLLNSDKSYSTKLLDSLVENFPDCEIFVLGRYSQQIEGIKKNYGSKVKITNSAIDGAGLLTVTDVFIGMGGTMTTEASLLGIPSISAFQGVNLYTEQFLIKEGLLVKPENIDQIINMADEFLHNKSHKKKLQENAEKLLKNMEDPVSVVIKTLEKSGLDEGIL